MNEEDQPSKPKDRLSRYATLGVIVGTAAWTTFFFSFLVISALFPEILPDSWLLELVREHPSGTLGIAIGAISAFSVVSVLDVFARDPIQIKFLQFELKGAAGPVVLWVICFLSFAAATELLWKDAASPYARRNAGGTAFESTLDAKPGLARLRSEPVRGLQ